MAVYDRWHVKDGPQPCREHSRGRAPLYPSAVHGQGDRWQVRWRDENGKQRKKNFRVREGRNPEGAAEAFDVLKRRELHTGDYADPDAANVTLQAFAEEWRRTRSHDTGTAAALERRLRLHVYEGEPGSGRTPRGGVAIGQRKIPELARRPSLIAAWIRSVPLAGPSARLVLDDVSAVFRAAVDDGIAVRDPTRSASVPRPARSRRKAKTWTPEQVTAMAAALPGRYAVIPYLGAGTGMRQGEMLGLAADDITFLGRDPRIAVTRQVKLVGNVPHFAPLKNRRPHTVPLAASLAPLLARHMELYPPVAVTLPWHDLRDREMHGKPVTARLLLTRPDGRAVDRRRFDQGVWHPAQEAAGITPAREPGRRRAPARDDGCHALRHTFASLMLAQVRDVVKVAAWMGDTPAVVYATYAHMLPGDDGNDGRAAVDAFFSGQRDRNVTRGAERKALCLVSVPCRHLSRK